MTIPAVHGLQARDGNCHDSFAVAIIGRSRNTIVTSILGRLLYISLAPLLILPLMVATDNSPVGPGILFSSLK